MNQDKTLRGTKSEPQRKQKEKETNKTSALLHSEISTAAAERKSKYSYELKGRLNQ